MAEAVIEERPTMSTRFYCHMCNVEINIPNTDYTCPLCSGGFVEELPEGVTAPENQNGTASSSTLGATSENNSGNVAAYLGLPLSDLESLRLDIASLLNSRNVPNLEITFEPGNRRANIVSVGGESGSGSGGSGSAPSGSSSGGNVAGGRVRPSNLDRLDNVLFDFLQSLPIGGNGTDFGNSHMFFMGNPGDYAWGREGLDTIVTQMLNQMETSGPPPLSKQRIEEISKVPVTQDDVDRKIQCSVCWDDFNIDEIVRKLPCSHIYHENCIVPWLNLHGTCPICRKSLIDEDNDEAMLIMDDDSSPEPSSCPLHGNAATSTRTNDSTENGSRNRSQARRLHFLRSHSHAAQQNQPQGEGANANATATTNNTSATTTRNNVFTFDDDNMNLD